MFVGRDAESWPFPHLPFAFAVFLYLRWPESRE